MQQPTISSRNVDFFLIKRELQSAGIAVVSASTGAAKVSAVEGAAA